MAQNDILNKEIDLNVKNSLTIYEDFSEEELAQIDDFYKTYYDSYVKKNANLTKWYDVSSSVLTGERVQSLDTRLEKKDSKKNIDYLALKNEVPITDVVIKYKVACLSSIAMGPDTVTYNGQLKPELNTALQYIWNKYIDLYVKDRIIKEGEINGIGFIKIEISDSSTSTESMPMDINVESVDVRDMLLDYTKNMLEQQIVIYRRNITLVELHNMDPNYEVRYNEGEEKKEPNVLGQIKKEDDTFEYLEVFIKANGYGGYRVNNILKVVIVDETIVDVIQTPYRIMPFAMYKPAEQEEVYKNSSLYKIIDIYDEYTRLNTAASRIMTKIVQPQYEIREGSLSGHIQENALKLNLPGAVFYSKDGQSIRVIQNEVQNQLEQILSFQDRLEQRMYKTIGLNPMNMGQDSGQIRGSMGIQQMLGTSQKPLTASVPRLSKFYEETALSLLGNLIAAAKNGKLLYASKDKNFDKAFNNLKLDEFKDSSLLNIDLSINTEQTDTQVAQNQILGIITPIMQFEQQAGELSPEMQALKQGLIATYVECMPIDSITKAKLMTDIEAVMKNQEQAKKAGLEQGLGSAMSIITQAQKSATSLQTSR